MIVLAAFLLGLLIGSFLNVCIHRLPRDESVVRPGSRCPECGLPIRWYDNIPLLSFVLLRGRCRECEAPIPWRYPVVEAVTAALFAVVASRYGPTLEGGRTAVFVCLMLILAVVDLTDRILPDPITLGGAVAGLVFSAAAPLRPGVGAFLAALAGLEPGPRATSLIESAAGAAVGAGALYLVSETYFRLRLREGMGLGDVKMMVLIGSFQGLAGAFWTLMLASVLGAVLGVLFILIFRKGMAYELPFGTFLSAAAILIVVWAP